MKDLQREIVNQVASGTISPEEGAARLDIQQRVVDDPVVGRWEVTGGGP